MDEHEWDACRDPDKMLTFLRDSGNTTDRKLRLFARACCRRLQSSVVADWIAVNDLLDRGAEAGLTRSEAEEAGSRIEEASEQLAWAVAVENNADEAALTALWHATLSCQDIPGVSWEKARAAAWNAALSAAWSTANSSEHPVWVANRNAERAIQAALVRDIFGPLPFRPLPPLPPSARTWNGGFIVKLATSIYEQRKLPEGTLDSVRMSVLADAMEESGVTDQEVLGHLRWPEAVHVKGCFVLDWLLGKQ